VVVISKIAFHYQRLDGRPVFDSVVFTGEIGQTLASPPLPKTLKGYHLLTEKLPATLTFTATTQDYLVVYVPDYQQLYVRILSDDGREISLTLTSRTGEKFDLSPVVHMLDASCQLMITYRNAHDEIIKQTVEKLPEIIADATTNGRHFFDSHPQSLVIEYAKKLISLTLHYVLLDTDVEIAPSRILQGNAGELIALEIPLVLNREDYLFEKVRGESTCRYFQQGCDLFLEYSINTAIIEKAQFVLAQVSDEKVSEYILALKTLLLQPEATAEAIKNLTAIVSAENSTLLELESKMKVSEDFRAAALITLSELEKTLGNVSNLLEKIAQKYHHEIPKTVALSRLEAENLQSDSNFIVSDDATKTLQSLRKFRDRIFKEI
jgi:hypothetical protein